MDKDYFSFSHHQSYLSHFTKVSWKVGAMSEEQCEIPWETIISLVTMFPNRQGIPRLCNYIYITNGKYLTIFHPSDLRYVSLSK